MCGIVGYVGENNSVDILMNGLYSLEYRGYDSAGISIVENDNIKTFKSEGKIENLQNILAQHLRIRHKVPIPGGVHLGKLGCTIFLKKVTNLSGKAIS